MTYNRTLTRHPSLVSRLYKPFVSPPLSWTVKFILRPIYNTYKSSPKLGLTPETRTKWKSILHQFGETLQVCYITRRASNWKKIEKTCHSSNALLRSTLHLSNNSNSPPSSIGSGTACAIYLRRPQPDALRADLSPQPLRFNRWRCRKRRRRHDLDRALLYRLRIRVGPKSPNLGLGVWWGRLVCFPAAPNVSYCFDRSGRVGNAPGFSRSVHCQRVAPKGCVYDRRGCLSPSRFVFISTALKIHCCLLFAEYDG